MAGCRIRIVRAGHCNGTDGVFQTVLVFEFDRSVRALLMQIAVKTAALNHEIVDDAVEDRTVIKTFIGVLDEVSNCRRSCFLIKVDNDVAFRGNDFNFRSGKANSRGSQQCSAESQFFQIKHGVRS